MMVFMFDALGRHVWGDALMKKPREISVELRPYQLEAIQWLVYRERKLQMIDALAVMKKMTKEFTLTDGQRIHVSRFGENVFLNQFTADSVQFGCRGGMLCDEMGLGKTLEIIALILSNPRDSNTSLLEGKPPFQAFLNEHHEPIPLTPRKSRKRTHQELDEEQSASELKKLCQNHSLFVPDNGIVVVGDCIVSRKQKSVIGKTGKKTKEWDYTIEKATEDPVEGDADSVSGPHSVPVGVGDHEAHPHGSHAGLRVHGP
ncbi:hypothetical protein Ciccas_007566 [Cichlidogyrus casuarinus]|uniref:SNF2 N-terminal domain-containing protein n=1 Tax=Cichlidogyrus casuarinus TaxID=1844966 RepID=A0ABD2Q3X6_9PLAT